MTLTLTPWMTGNPVRVGWYAASAERNTAMRSHWDGTQWSVQVDEAASDDELDLARSKPMRHELQRDIEFCGLTEHSVAWLDAELNR